MNILKFTNFKEIKETTKNDTKFIPKFQLFEKDNKDIVPGWSINKPMKYDRSKMIKAIQNGMVILISYKGDEDNWKSGRERTIYPMVLGINKNTGNELLRGWHLDGYSVSAKKNLEKVWRLFKTDNIKSMMFTGDFYRLMPKGYKMNDRGMTEKTIQRARYNDIVRNQKRLLQTGKIEDEKRTQVTDKISIEKINVKNLDSTIDLYDPFSNEILAEKEKNAKNIKACILKSVLGNNWIYVLNVGGYKGKSVIVYSDNKDIGTFKVMESFTLDKWKKYRNTGKNRELPLYLFEEKRK